MPTKLYRFGLFELDTDGRQLLKQGRRIRLQEQPLRTLEILLEEPGRLVTRAELRQRLWPADIHVDFELGLTGAIKRLRLALDDSADNPRFVETVPKSGYRFVAPVEVVAGPGAPEPAVAATGHGGSAAVAPLAASAGRAGARVASPALHAVAIVLVTAALAAAAYLRPVLPAPRVTRVARLTGSGNAWPQESLLSDGARLYYTEFVVGAGFRLRQVLLNGNEDTVVGGLPADALVRALSPDDTTFTIISRDAAASGEPSPLWQVPVVGGPARRVGSVQSNDFAWSPDGEAMVFGRDDRLFASRPDGSGERLLASCPGHVVCPRWSPGGRRLRFTVLGQNGELSLWEVGADGARPHALELPWNGPPAEGFGDWTRDGRYYVFVSRREGISNLWALEERGDWLHRRRREPMQLTAGPLSYYRPLPSRSGTQIFTLGTEPNGELVRYDAGRREFTPFLGGRSAEYVDFSRDGRWLAYVAYPEGTLWRARLDGSEELQLTTPPLRAFLPRWSPDGRHIVFAARRPGTRTALFDVSPDGGSVDRLLDEPEGQADPTWSAAGDALLYGRDRDEAGGHVALYRLELRSRRSQRLPGTEGLHAPLWSPDGRHLAVRSAASGRLFLLDPDSGRTTPLSRRSGDYAVWSADSRYLYFNSAIRQRVALFRVRVADGTEQEIAELPFRPVGSWGIWSGVTPDGSPLVLRDRGTTDVYALALSFDERH